MKFAFHPEAEAEFNDAISWYEDREQGLGESSRKSASSRKPSCPRRAATALPTGSPAAGRRRSNSSNHWNVARTHFSNDWRARLHPRRWRFLSPNPASRIIRPVRTGRGAGVTAPSIAPSGHQGGAGGAGGSSSCERTASSSRDWLKKSATFSGCFMNLIASVSRFTVICASRTPRAA